MLQTSHCVDSQQRTRGSRKPSVASLMLAFSLVGITLSIPRTAARAADSPNAAANGGSPSNDFLERTMRKNRAAQRVEELDQEAWRAISKDGEFELAAATMSQAAELARSEFGGQHWLTILKESLAAGLKSLEKLPQDRRQLFVNALKGESVAAFQFSQGNRERALAQLRQAQDKRSQALGADHILSVYGLLGLSSTERGMQEYGEAKHHAGDAVRVLKTIWGEKNPGWAHALYFLAMAEAGLRELDAAERDVRTAIEILEPVAREGFNDFYLVIYSDALLYLARFLNEQERYGDAEPFARRGADILAFAPRQAYAKFLESQLDVAHSVSGQGKIAEAEIIFTCLFKSLPSNSPPEVIARFLSRYAEHLRRDHRDVDAEELELRVRKLSAKSRNPQS